MPYWESWPTLRSEFSSTSLLGLLVLSLVLYGCLTVLYRLTCHPLAGIPGPRIAAATKWYEFYFDVVKDHGGQYAWMIERMHDKYGPIVRVNPDEVHIRDSSFYPTLYASAPARRDKYFPAASMAGSPLGTFGTVDHDLHRRRRQANNIFFSKRAVESTLPMLYQQAGLLCDNLVRAHHERTILRTYETYVALTTDTIWLYIFGKSLGYLKSDVATSEWAASTAALPQVTPLIKQFPWAVNVALKMPQQLLYKFVPDLAKVLGLHTRMRQEAFEHRERNANQFWQPEDADKRAIPPTIFHAIDQSRLPDNEKSVVRMAQEGFVFLAAGPDTTARALTCATYYLVSNPAILKQLRDELSTVMHISDMEPDLKKLEELPFFRAVLKESLRIMALVTSRLPLVAPETLRYGDISIPAKTPISMTIHDVLTDPCVFPDPCAFAPDRWLEDGQLHKRLDPYFVAFGRGTRMCAGMNFAWVELHIVLSLMMMRFDFELHDTLFERDIRIRYDYFFGEPARGSKGVQMRVIGLRGRQ